MITNPLLEAKYRVQKQLDDDARHNIEEYARLSHCIVTEIEAKHRIRFQYASPSDGAEHIDSLASGRPSRKSVAYEKHECHRLGAVPVSEAEKVLLELRLTDMELNSQDQSRWPDVQARLKRRLP